MTAIQPTILLIENEPAVRDSVKKILREEGWHILDAADSTAALHVVAKRPTDLVLLSLRMPQLDGLDFLQRFRRSQNDWITPVCVVTAGLEGDGRRRAIDLGADDFIRTPIDPVELKVRVSSLLRIGNYQREFRALSTHLELQVEERTQILCANMSRLETANQESDLAYRETVLRLSLAAEMQDECSAAHLERMSSYSALLAKKCGWSGSDIELLTQAAKMHDIGKLGIPREILTKPGKLNKREFAIMQQHPEIGARILAGSKSKLLQMGAIIALNHHEHFDGSGYPQGLTGKNIPQVGRIVAIADVFDALMTHRSHKHAWSLEATVATMRNENGVYFDPDLLDLFLEDTQVLSEIHFRFNEDFIWEQAPYDLGGQDLATDPSISVIEVLQ